jgi:predicted Ser/Thr protein kinase
MAMKSPAAAEPPAPAAEVHWNIQQFETESSPIVVVDPVEQQPTVPDIRFEVPEPEAAPVVAAPTPGNENQTAPGGFTKWLAAISPIPTEQVPFSTDNPFALGFEESSPDRFQLRAHAELDSTVEMPWAKPASIAEPPPPPEQAAPVESGQPDETTVATELFPATAATELWPIELPQVEGSEATLIAPIPASSTDEATQTLAGEREQTTSDEQDSQFPSLATGQSFGHYKITGRLGRGGMGVVYKALDTKLQRPVALKVMSTDSHDTQKSRFIREARAASALNHRNIVTIYELSSADGLDFIAMEYIQGVTIGDLLDAGSKSRSELLGYARQIADAVAAAHKAGIVHRDLKPGNVMVAADGLVKVLDFGLARYNRAAESGSGETQSVSLTVTGSIVGTPSYMSPEQVLGDAIDHQSDIFSFGIILYQIVCGRLPFKGMNMRATMMQIVNLEPTPVSKHDPTVPPPLVSLIERCLTKDKARRLQSIATASEELGALLDANRIEAAPPPRRPFAIGAWWARNKR